VEIDTPVRIVSLLFGGGIVFSVAATLISNTFGLPNPGMVIWAVVAPGFTSYVYGKKYKRGMPKALRIRSVLIYFAVLSMLGIITLYFGEGGFGEEMEWVGVYIFAAFCISLITYLIFRLSGMEHDDP